MSTASFLNRLLLRVPSADPTVEASFELLNEMGSSDDRRVVDLVSAGVFEILTDSPASIKVARELLYAPAIDLFERMVQLWGAEAGDQGRPTLRPYCYFTRRG
jgi:hypothetical protein